MARQPSSLLAEHLLTVCFILNGGTLGMQLSMGQYALAALAALLLVACASSLWWRTIE